MTRLSLAGWIWLALAAAACAQEPGTAVLNGGVADPSGAVVSGAPVTAQNNATGDQAPATATKTGWLVMNNLPPGEYEVQVQASGFGPAASRVRLEVGQQANLRVRLKVESKETIINDHH